MNIQYPIFIFEKGDLTIDMFESFKQLHRWYELVDMMDGLFEGWDNEGKYINVRWNPKKQLEELNIVDAEINLHALKSALLKSAEIKKKKIDLEEKLINILSPKQLYQKLV